MPVARGLGNRDSVRKTMDQLRANGMVITVQLALDLRLSATCRDGVTKV